MNNRHIQTGLVFIVVCLLIGLGLAYFTMARVPATTDGNVLTASANAPLPIDNLQTASTTIEAVQPDFLVTDALRQDKPAWEELGEGPNGTQFCAGSKARLTNGSSRRLNLKLVVDESDDETLLGSVQPGSTLIFEPGDIGKWNLVDADDGGPLFQYEVTACTANGDRALAVEEASASPASSLRSGSCTLEVGGTSLINGPCYYVLKAGGSFSIADTESDGGYRAQVTLDNGVATGSWNGERGADSSEDLGTLNRSDACWTNEQAKICLRS